MSQSTLAGTSERHQVSDQELIRLAIQGNSRGYEGLLGRYQDRLFRSIQSVVGCSTLAEDIVQEAFVNAFLKLDTFKGHCAFYTWLYRIALNARRPYFRNAAPTVSIDTEGERMICDGRESPTKHIERVEECDQVRRAMMRLEEHHRAILILREYDGLDYEAIAESLGINIGTVRSRLSRARASLRKELSSYVGVTTRVPSVDPGVLL